MINRIQSFLSKYIGNKIAYKIVYYTYAVITLIPILLIGYYLNTIVFIIISFILTNFLRKYTYGLHFTNGKCFIFTLCILIIFSYISKTTPTYLLLGIGLFCMRDIYIKSPLKLTVKNKDLKWHQDIIMLSLGIILILISLSILIDLTIIINGIMCSIIMIDLTLFIKERV